MSLSMPGTKILTNKMTLTALEITTEDLLRSIYYQISIFSGVLALLNAYGLADVCISVRRVSNSCRSLHVDTRISCPSAC
jgi:hypothetical protein